MTRTTRSSCWVSGTTAEGIGAVLLITTTTSSALA